MFEFYPVKCSSGYASYKVEVLCNYNYEIVLLEIYYLKFEILISKLTATNITTHVLHSAHSSSAATTTCCVHGIQLRRKHRI